MNRSVVDLRGSLIVSMPLLRCRASAAIDEGIGRWRQKQQNPLNECIEACKEVGGKRCGGSSL